MTSTVHSRTEHLQEVLEQQIERHTQQLTELTEYSRQADHGGYDPVTLNGLIASARQGLADAAEALQRMANGSYGTCQKCGVDIPTERLEVIPHARYCVKCQSKAL